MNVSHRLLVVDDDASIRRLLHAIFTAKGFEVIEAGNGEEALQLVMHPRPCAILLDLEMPVMDGERCYRALRARGIAAPVLILSAADAEVVADELGADAGMSKPFRIEELTALMGQLVRPRCSDRLPRWCNLPGAGQRIR